ncbi:MAG: hypothetical protein O3A00_14140 [Planctomycetota bacterium]|nr:hypothetical protein [Planctomycetota bacterium]
MEHEPVLSEPADELFPVGAGHDSRHTLSAFLEKRNIRWGEIISGMLIVGSSIGLVISLWSTLKNAIPFFPALLFLLATAAIHGAGVYTLKRWRLKSTSQGLLIISALLVPLNFLAAISLSERDVSVTSPIYMLAVVVGALGYGVITSSCGRLLMLRGWWMLPLAVMGPSLSQLVIARNAVSSPEPSLLWMLFAVPLASFLVATGSQIWMSGRWQRITPRRCNQMFLVLGTASFALVMAAALLVVKVGDIRSTLSTLAPGISLISICVIGIGFLIHQRLQSAKHGNLRLGGTSLIPLGAMGIVGAVATAWPRPDLLIVVGLLSFASLAFFAFAAKLPDLHYPAVASLVLAYMVGFHAASDTIAEATSVGLVDAFLLGRSSAVLFVGAILVGLVGTVCRRAKRMEDASRYTASAAALVLLSILVALHAGFLGTGFADVSIAGAILLLSGIAMLAAAAVIRRMEFTWPTAGFWFVAVLHSLQFNPWISQCIANTSLVLEPAWTWTWWIHGSTLVAYAMLLFAVSRSGAEVQTEPDLRDAVLLPLIVSGLAMTGMAALGELGPALQVGTSDLLAASSRDFAWYASMWLVGAIILVRREFFVVAQCLGTFALVLGVASFTAQQPWFTSFLEVRHIHSQLTALAIWCIGWLALRSLLRWQRVQVAWMDVDRSPFELVITGGMLTGLLAVAVANASPVIFTELTLLAAPVPIEAHRELMLAAVAALALCIAAFGPLRSMQLDSSETQTFGAGLGIALTVLVGVVAFAVDQNAGNISEVNPVADWTFWTAAGLATALLLIHRFTPGTTAPPSSAHTTRTSSKLADSALVERGLTDGGLFMVICSVLLTLAVGLADYRATLISLTWMAGFVALAHAGVAVYSPRLANDSDVAGLFSWRSSIWTAATGVILIAAFAAVAASFRGSELLASTAGLFWKPIGPDAANVVSLVLLASAFAMAAYRQRVTAFLIAATLTVQLAVNVVALRWVWVVNVSLDGLHHPVVVWAQVNGIGLAIGSLVWHFARRSFTDDNEALAARRTLATLRKLAVACVVIPLLPALQQIVFQPGLANPLTASIGSTLGIAAFLCVAASVWPYLIRAASTPITIGVLLSGLSVQISAVVLQWDSPIHWHAYHALMGGWFVAAVAVLLFGWRDSFRRDSDEKTRLWTVGAIVVAVVAVGFLTAHAAGTDPLRPLPIQAFAFAAATLLSTLTLRTREAPLCVLSVACWGLAASSLAIDPWTGTFADPARVSVVPSLLAAVFGTVAGILDADEGLAGQTLVLLALVGAVLSTIAWCLCDLIHQHRRNARLLNSNRMTPATIAEFLVAFFGLMVVSRLLWQALGIERVDFSTPTAFGVLFAIGLLAAMTFWDRMARPVFGALFCWGLTGGLMVLDQLGDQSDFIGRDYVLSLGVLASVYAVVTSLLLAFRGMLRATADQLRIPNRPTSEDSQLVLWLIPANFGLALTTVVIGFWSVLHVTVPTLRIVSASSILILASLPILLEIRRLQTECRIGSLLLAALAAVAFGWAVMPINDAPHDALFRAVRVLVSLGLTAILYGVVLLRLLPRSRSWHKSARWSASFLGGLAMAVLIVVLSMEVVWPGVLAGPEIASVAVVLAGLAVAFICLAVIPDVDPLTLSERGRMWYVYAAEAVMGLLFLHIRLTMPELFSGLLLRYWPFITIAIAYFGVGVGEVCRRKRLTVMSEPLHRTAAFLPLIPMLAFQTSGLESGFSTLLFLAGLMYLVLSMWRQSFAYALCAAFVGNAGLWALFHENGLQLAERPQLWLIPPALSVLLAAQWNKNRLTLSQLTNIRYLAVTVIYVSSSGEMFIHGIGGSLWLPIVLSLLSIAGVFVGILLRVRTFLYLGASFLLLSIVSMVWHAAVRIQEVWPWWAFGIVMGMLMLAVFGLFEKKRNELLGVMNDLKRWDK